MHLVFLPKFYITIVSNLSWVLQSSQEESKTMALQIFLEGMEGMEVGGGGRVCTQGALWSMRKWCIWSD